MVGNGIIQLEVVPNAGTGSATTDRAVWDSVVTKIKTFIINNPNLGMRLNIAQYSESDL